MENKYLYPDTTNIFENEELEFRVSQINEEGTNVKEVFEANLVNFIHQYKRFPNSWESEQIIDSAWIYNQYSNGQLYVMDDESIGDESPCSEFVRFEIYHFLLEIKPKCKIYFNFIETYGETYQIIDRLTNRYNGNIKSSDCFRNYAKAKLQNVSLDYATIENAFYRLEKLIIKSTLLDLIHFLKIIKKESYEQEINQVFDMDYFLNPALIQEPIELRNYCETVKTWIKKIGQDLKFKLNLPFIPNMLEWLVLEIGNDAKSEALEEETKEYPKYIFTNYKAFDLFDTIAKEMTTHPQISFLFRQMNEKEKPALIVVENSDFIKWFNQQNYSFTIDYPTKTFEQSKTEDRIVLYNVVKNLKISK